MKTRVMLDIETLGTCTGSVILAIGAVKFGNNQILDHFYERVSPESCVQIGLKMDISTVMWWMKQSDEARLEITKEGTAIIPVLQKFGAWIADSDAEIWGNGAAFDNAQLVAAYQAALIHAPWEFWNDRCYRTMKNLFPDVQAERKGTLHHALDDAIHQAFHLMDILNFAGLES
jgi:DNA polymerase III alpha subunit (gram-positive type)